MWIARSGLAALFSAVVSSAATAGTVAELTQYGAFLAVSLPSSGVTYSYNSSGFSQGAFSQIEQFGTTTEPVVSQTPDTTATDFFSLTFQASSGGGAIGDAKALNSADKALMEHSASSGVLTVTNNSAQSQTIDIDLATFFEVFWYDDTQPLTKITVFGFNFGEAFAEAQVHINGSLGPFQSAFVDFNTTSYPELFTSDLFQGGRHGLSSWNRA